MSDIVDWKMLLVEIHDEAPVVEPAASDHITEADLYVASGGIEIVGCGAARQLSSPLLPRQPGHRGG
jgi:hypothetical protein